MYSYLTLELHTDSQAVYLLLHQAQGPNDSQHSLKEKYPSSWFLEWQILAKNASVKLLLYYKLTQ